MMTASAAFNTANLKLQKQPIYALEIDGYNRVFTNRTTGVAGHYPWIKEIGDLSFEVSALDGSSALGDLTVTVLDYQRLITVDYPQLTLEGRVCRLKTGFPGMDYADYLTVFTGKLENIPTSEMNNCYDFVAKDTRLNTKQVIYLTADNGKPTDDDNHKTILGNPIEVIKSVLLTYCGIAPADVDTATLDAYRDTVFAGVTFEFDITSPPEAKAFLESQLFKPMGGYLRANNLGKLTPHFFIPLPGAVTPVMTLDRSTILGVPEIQQADLVNVLSYRFDKEDDKYTSESVLKLTASVTKYGMQGQQIIECDGVRSGFQGYFLGNMVARAIFDRYGDKNPKLDLGTLWGACKLEPGDLVLVTHSLIPDRKAGVLGIVEKMFEVENRTLNFTECKVELTLVDASRMQTYGAFRIAPDVMPNWTIATQAEKERYMFVASSAGLYSDASAGHPLA